MRIVNLLLRRYKWLGRLLGLIMVIVFFVSPATYQKGTQRMANQIVQNAVEKGEREVKYLSGVVEQWKKDMNLK